MPSMCIKRQEAQGTGEGHTFFMLHTYLQRRVDKFGFLRIIVKSGQGDMD